MRFLLRTLISAAVIFGVAYLSKGALLPQIPFVTALVLALVLAVVNLIVKPIVHLVSLPVTILTLGLFSLVINTGMLLLAEQIAGVASTGFWPTLLAALIISVVTSVLTKALEDDR